MASWNKRARLIVAFFGLATAAVVYVGMGERQQAAPPEPPRRMDPKAIFEATAGLLERVSGIATSFELKSARWQAYADGSTRHFGVAITVPKGGNRTFTVFADEAYAGKGQVELQLTGNIRLQDSDGFFLTTDRATYNQETLVAHAPGAVRFGKGRMSGSGENVGYDQAKDTLTVASTAQVTTVDEAGTPVMQFTAGAATLDRIQHVLTLDSAVHVVRGEEMIDADHAVARLAGNDDVITFVELRGNSRVAGGGASIDSMSARDIDLDYTDDGKTLERVRLAGSAAIGMAGDEGGGGSQLVGETVDLDLAGDGSLTRAVADGNVRLDLPAAAPTPARSIRAQALDATGEPGKGLTRATFTRDVVFSEQPPRSGGGAAAGATRTARAQKLEAGLASDAVTTATFTGEATFEEPGLKACAGRMDYQPDKGSLDLSNATGSGNPIVAEEQIAIEAQAIGIALGTRRMLAKGDVTTRMGGEGRCRPEVARQAAERGAMRMPSLLDEKGSATITAAALDYDGDSGRAVYSGRAALVQGETTIHADTLTLEQATGNLRAAGNVTSKITMDGIDSLGQSQELVYDDKARRVSYASPPPAPAAVPAGRGAAPPLPAVSRVQGPMGDLRANWIDIVLAAEGGDIERISARSNVRIVEGTRDVTGGATFTYDPVEEKYVVTGQGSVPVRFVNRQGLRCREMTGRSLTFYRSGDRIVFDGQDKNQTQIEPLACPAPAR